MTAIHVLLLVALVEVALNRIAVPMLRPALDEPPGWHVALDYLGLYAFYFTNLLVVFVLVARATRPALHRRFLALVLGLAALVAAIPILVDSAPWMNVGLEILFALGALAVLPRSLEADRDLGVRIGLPLLLVPLLFHSVIAGLVAIEFSEDTFAQLAAQLGPGHDLGQLAAIALAGVALISPYVFAPRPFARAVTRPVPILVAMVVAAAGAVVTKLWYPGVAKASELALGVPMNAAGPDPRQALYLLALSTLAWTITACLLAPSPARRTIGAGLALIALGGYAFQWPHQYLLPLLGLALIDDAARRVREEESAAAGAFVPATPPISDTTWLAYVSLAGARLARTFAPVHSLSSNGEGGLSSTIVVGEHRGLTVRTRLERLHGAVIALDIIVGREIEEVRGATLVVSPHAGEHPAGPPATPEVRTGEAAFDRRFAIRGKATALDALTDAELRTQMVGLLDGWLAYWEGEGVRYRLYPGRGAPVEQPVPLSELALGTVPPDADRLAAVVELVAELGARAIAPATL